MRLWYLGPPRLLAAEGRTDVLARLAAVAARALADGHRIEIRVLDADRVPLDVLAAEPDAADTDADT